MATLPAKNGSLAAPPNPGAAVPIDGAGRPASPIDGRRAVGPLAVLFAGTSLRYWVCLCVLGGAAVGLHSAARKLGWWFRKEPVPLKKSLLQFDLEKLGPRYAKNEELQKNMQDLSEDMIDSLGTRDFYRVFLNDRQTPREGGAALASLMITYYPNPDRVPHVPEECYHAAGWEQVGSAVTERVPAPGVGAPDDKIPVRLTLFQRKERPGEMLTVLYVFHVNGGWATTRDEVRGSMMKPWLRYGYYSKIELTFSSASGHPATREESLAAAGPLLAQVMPVLLSEHFDLHEFVDAGAAGASRR